MAHGTVPHNKESSCLKGECRHESLNLPANVTKSFLPYLASVICFFMNNQTSVSQSRYHMSDKFDNPGVHASAFCMQASSTAPSREEEWLPRNEGVTLVMCLGPRRNMVVKAFKLACIVDSSSLKSNTSPHWKDKCPSQPHTSR